MKSCRCSEDLARIRLHPKHRLIIADMARYANLLLVLCLLTVHTPSAAQDAPRLRVLTYNIHHGEAMDGKFDYERLASVITALAPDVVALQEVDRGTKRSAGADQAALLAKLTRTKSVFGNALYFQGGEYGDAILSRFPMRDAKAHHLPFRYGQEPRTALEVRIQPNNGLPDFIFVGTHLCNQSEATRLDQVKELNRILPADAEVPVILAGDLNARSGSAPMKTLLATRWKDAIAPNSEIDYILLRPEDPWKILEVRIVEELVVSDHKPVLAVLEWGGEAER